MGYVILPATAIAKGVLDVLGAEAAVKLTVPDVLDAVDVVIAVLVALAVVREDALAVVNQMVAVALVYQIVQLMLVLINNNKGV